MMVMVAMITKEKKMSISKRDYYNQFGQGPKAQQIASV